MRLLVKLNCYPNRRLFLPKGSLRRMLGAATNTGRRRELQGFRQSGWQVDDRASMGLEYDGT